MKRRLIFVNRYFYPDHSATSQLLSDLAFDLASAGMDVKVVTGRQRYDDAHAALPHEDTINGVRILRVASTRFGRSKLPGRTVDYVSFYCSAAIMLWRVVNRGDVVIAKTDPPLISVIAAAICRLKRADLINWMQDVFPEVAEALRVLPDVARPIVFVLRGTRNWSMRVASTNVVLGAGMASHFARVNSRAVVSIIANWALSEAQPAANERDELRKKWGLDDKFVVGYSGNLGRAHESKTILDAATSCRDVRDLVFLFVGGGAQRAQLEQETRNRGLSNVIFKEYQPRELLHLALAVPDVHLVSLLPVLEGLIVPSKFFGIAAAGRAAIYIGSAEGDVAKYILASGCGFVVAPGDFSALKSAILELRENSELCRRMGAHAEALFHARFTREIALKKWRQVLTTA